MTRNQAGSYAKLLVDFLCQPKQKIGEGVCVEWESNISATHLSDKSRIVLKLRKEDEISLEEIRSWSSMKLPASFKQGPRKDDGLWRRDVSWSSFLRIIVEVVSGIFGQNAECSPTSSPAPTTRPAPPRPPPSAVGLSGRLIGSSRISSQAASFPPNFETTTHPSERIVTGEGPLTDCLTSWVIQYPHLTLSSLPLDVQHPPRLQVH